MLRVPTDYAHPSTGEQQLAVLRVPARGGKPRGVLFVNPGGPGMPATQFARPFADALPGSLRSTFDLVVMDPRGVGESGYISCLGGAATRRLDAVDLTPETDQERVAVAAAMAELGRSCAQRQPSLIGHVATESFARDVDVLRSVLKTPRLDILGYSYGTLLGYQYARLFPDHVGRLVLDGVVDPGTTPALRALEQASTAQVALEEVAGDCVDHDCPLGETVPEVVKAITRLQEKLDQAPVTLTEQGSEHRVDDAALTMVMYRALYYPDAGFSLGEVVADLRDGDPQAFLQLQDELNALAGQGARTVLNGIAWATECLDEPRAMPTPGERLGIQEASPVFGTLLATTAEACRDWPVPAQPAPMVRLKPSITALVVSNEVDPATPRAAAERLAALIPSAVHLRTPLIGHTAAFLGEECVDSAVSSYLIRGDMRPAEHGCS